MKQPNTVFSWWSEDTNKFIVSKDNPIATADPLARPAQHFPSTAARRGCEEDFDLSGCPARAFEPPIDSRTNDARIIKDEHIGGV